MKTVNLTKTINGYDIDFENGDIKTVEDFNSLILISLFTEGRYSGESIRPENSRGWLGDMSSDRNIGSLLWTTEQSRLTQKKLNETIGYGKSALQWMIDDLIVKSIIVTGEIVPRSGIKLNIEYYTLNGVLETTYINMWEKTNES